MAASLEIIAPDSLAPLNLSDYFPKPAPLEIDLGCGDGTFLIEMAQRRPNHNFLGIERLPARVAKTGRKAERRQLQNVRLLAMESAHVVRHLLSAASVRTFYISFPDPWPKRRHWKNRLVQPELITTIHTALEPGGELRVKTDNANYFEHMRNVFAAQTLLREIAWEPEPDYPITTFESHFLAQGLPIYCARLVKT